MFIYKIYSIYLFFFIASVSHTNIVDCNVPTYAIAAAKIIRPRDEYNVIVSLNEYTNPTEVICTLERKPYQLNNISDISPITYRKTTSHNESTLIFKMKSNTKWTDVVYKLHVEGTGGLIFNEEINIKFVDEKLVILVQSDKAIYKPGETVLFRVLILDENLRPVNIKDLSNMKIHITDPLDNILREFFLNNGQEILDPTIHTMNKFGYNKGVADDMSYLLQKEAMVGEWKIQVITRGQIQNYTFFVDNYQLPLANVNITLSEYVTHANTILDYHINCFYTYGKPVKGSVELLITKLSECGKIVENSTVWYQNILIDGQISNKIDLKITQLNNSSCNEMRLNVTAIVKDSKTGSIFSNFEVFNVYQHDMKAHLISKQKMFKPGKSIRQHIKILDVAGKVINKNIFKNITCEAEFKTSFGNELIKTKPDKITKDETNIVCDFKTNITTTELYIKLIYEEKIIIESVFESFTGCSDSFVQVMLEEPLEYLMVGQTVNLVISSNEPIKKLIYFIVIHGIIVNSSSPVFDKVIENTIKLPIVLTKEMVPGATVAVYFISPYPGVVVSDALHLKVTDFYHPEVTFDVPAPLVNTSQKALIYIEAEADSELFILGVNEAESTLEQGNDIFEKRVFEQLRNALDSTESANGFLQSGIMLKSNAQPECEIYQEISDLKGDVITNRKDDKHSLHFQQTWIWARMSMSSDNHRTGFKVKVLDSINTWRLTAFSINDDKGLALTTVPGYVNVFRPFFIKTNVPFSLRREESSEIHVSAFNYLNDTSDVDIQIFVDDNDVRDLSLSHCRTSFLMKPNDIKTFICYVTTHKVGKFNLLAVSSAKSASQIVSVREIITVLVVEEGFVQQMSKSVLFNLTNDNANEIIERIKVEGPIKAINGSQKVYASVSAELLTIPWKDGQGSILKNRSILGSAQHDLSYPGASCQQRTAYSFFEIYWLNFLKTSKKLTKEINDYAENMIQRSIDLLCFLNPNDGSFVRWDLIGKSSVWQTAYNLKLMNHAKYHVRISHKIIEKAENWLKQRQVESGEFLETDNDNQISSSTHFGAYLTSYVYIALNSSYIKDVNSTAKSEAYLTEIFDSLTHPLDIVITCYALHIANHVKSNVCYNKVLKMSELESNMRYWKGTDNKPDLQITAYVLMILNIRNSNVIAHDVFRFLISKQHPNGWFTDNNVVDGNSLTTVVCLEAMTQYINLLPSYEPKVEDMIINFNLGDEKQSLHIKQDNDILQSIELSSDAKEVQITASGYGRSKAQIYWQFYTKESIGDSFNISAKKIRKRGDEYISLDICTKYNLEGKAKNVILEIDLPSGYTCDKNGMKNLSEMVDYIEAINLDTHINAYLREVTQNGICINISAFQSFEVENRKPIPLKVYPYYDRSHLTTRSWNTSTDL